MPSTSAPLLTITTIAAKAGLKRYEVATLIKEHGLRTAGPSNCKVIDPRSLPRLVEILSRYPGVDPGFAASL